MADNVIDFNGVGDGWLDPVPLPDLLPDVAEFEPMLLPESFRGWVEDISERMQVPPDFAGASSMVALASTVGTQLRIRPKQKDPWTINPNLWGMIVAPPGTLKSPVLGAVMKPLSRLEVAFRKEHENAVKIWKASKTVRAQKKKVFDKKIKTALEQGNDEEANKLALQLEEEETGEPSRRRLIINDSTVQKLGELLNENENGLLLYRDELPGFLQTLDKEGHESDRGFYLEAWNGTDPYTYDRIGRGTLHIKHSCVSILGGIQPGRIADYVRRASAGTSGDDGFLQRFQMVVYPDTPEDWKYVDEEQNQEAVNKAYAVFEQLSKINTQELGAIQESREDVPYLNFDAAAQELFIEWMSGYETRIRSGNEDSIMESHLSKYRKLVPALALLIHLAEGEIGGVGYSALQRACAWADYLETHAKRVYAGAINTELDGAYTLLKHLKQGKLESPFVIRDIYRKGWTGLKDKDVVKDAVTLLIEHHYLVAENSKDGKDYATGKPTEYLYINERGLK